MDDHLGADRAGVGGSVESAAFGSLDPGKENGVLFCMDAEALVELCALRCWRIATRTAPFVTVGDTTWSAIVTLRNDLLLGVDNKGANPAFDAI